MKNPKILFLAITAFTAMSIASCSNSDTSANPVTNPVISNTGDLKLFVIDTAKVNTVTMAGLNETIIINRKVNTNSYIGGLSLKNDGLKLVYVDNQGSFTNGGYVDVKSVHVANSDGSGDTSIYTAPSNTVTSNTDIGLVKFGTSKIYFTTTTQTVTGGLVSSITKLNSSNFDGSNLVAEDYSEAPLTVYKADITSDGRYLTTLQSDPNIPRFVIIDRTGDNGGGTVIYQEDLTAANSNGLAPVFSNDNKFAYFAFSENQSLKVRIVNMTTLTVETKTIATNFTPTSSFLSFSIGSDNNRGVVVSNTYGNIPSKTYVFNLANNSSTSFNNNDSNIFYLKAF